MTEKSHTWRLKLSGISTKSSTEAECLAILKEDSVAENTKPPSVRAGDCWLAVELHLYVHFVDELLLLSSEDGGARFGCIALSYIACARQADNARPQFGKASRSPLRAGVPC